MLKLLTTQRYSVFVAAIVLTALCLLGSLWAGWLFVPFLIFGAFTALGIRDVRQNHHAVTKNYPLIGHIRFLFEKIRPEIRQYLIEGDKDEQPFSREHGRWYTNAPKVPKIKAPLGPRKKCMRQAIAG